MIGYLRIYLFISILTPGFYFAVIGFHHESIFYYALAAGAFFSALLLTVKLPDVTGDPESYPN